MTELAAALADRYRVERELGQGGMATVYLAEDLKHGRQVAIKVLRPELAAVIGAERFLREIRTIATLQHPHILGLIDSGEVSGNAYYVMPYVEGESLRDRLSREKQLSVSDGVRLAAEVAGALDYAHRHGVIHRDIKPENILLHDGRALVADFGIALAVSSAGTGSRMTETGMSLGTPHYMSPEQAMGERDITARSDIYALGCVTYEMLVGEPPFNGPTAQAIVARVMTEAPRSLVLQRHTIPPQVEAAVLVALEKLPADRFATAAQFAEAITSSSGSTAWTTATQARLAAPAVTPRSRALALLPWALALAGLLAASWAWLARTPRNGVSWQHVTFPGGPVLALGPSLALSPDGEQLVLKDVIQNGRLWLKRRNELDPVPIAGTERGFYPAFSPDGEWISFVADGQLKKIRPGEGAAVTLADSAALPFGGATWLDDGSLVYVGPGQLELSQVSANGGPTKVILSPAKFSGLGLALPTPLPGGRGVLFTACTSGCVTVGVHVLDLKTGQERLLLNDVVGAWYLPTGQLFFVRRDGAGLVAAFDLRTLQLSGAATPVLERVRIAGGLPMIAWSPSGALAYVQGTGQATDVEFVRVTREGVATPIDTAWHGGFTAESFSPDGRRLAVGVGVSAGALGIWIKQLDRGPFTRLTFGGQDRRPAWSPDGKVIAFIRDSLNSSSVVARNADGSGSDRLMARLDRAVQEVTWSPDGHWLVLRTDNGTAGAGDLIGVRVSGDTTPVPLVATGFTEQEPAVSPDGRWLAYASNESGTNEIYVRPFPATAAARWQVSTGGGEAPRWSPDGRELYFYDGAQNLLAAGVARSATFEVTGVRPLFQVSGYANLLGFHQGYDVLPNGAGFLFTRTRGSTGGLEGMSVVQVENWFADLRARTRR